MLGAKLASLREAKGVSQQEVAEALGVSHKTVCGWETGYRHPNLDMFSRLALYYGVSTDELLGLASPDVRDVAPDDMYLSMAQTLREHGVTRRDLDILLETRRRFLEINDIPT